MFAGIRLKPHWGYFNRMPTTAVEYARIAVNRQSKTLIFRSDNYGHTWTEVTPVRFRIKKPGEGEGVELLPIGGPS